MTLTDAQQTALAAMLRRAGDALYADCRDADQQGRIAASDQLERDAAAAHALAAAIDRAATVTLADEPPTEPRCTICDRPNLRPCQPCADMIAAGWIAVDGQWRHPSRQTAE